MSTYPVYTGLLEQQLSDVGTTPLRVLIIAQDPTIAANTLLKNIQLSDLGNSLDVTGNAADMVREFRTVNNITQIDVLALKEASGSIKAAGSFTFDGTATAGGVLTFYIAKYQGGNSTDNRDNCTFNIPVAIGDTDAVICGKLTTAIQAATPLYLYSIVTQSNAKMLEVQAVCGGPAGDEGFIGYTGKVTGVTVTVAETTSGSIAPTISDTDLNTMLNNLRYQKIVVQAGLDPAPFVKLVESRRVANLKDLSGILILGRSDGYNQILQYVQNVNSNLACCVSSNSFTESNWMGSVFGLPTFTLQAQFAGIMCMRQTDGVDISPFMYNQYAQVGGLYVYPLPYFNTKMTNAACIYPEKNFTSQQIIDLNDAGAMPLDWDDTSNSVIMSDGVTCTSVSLGQRLHSLNSVEIALAVREIVANNYRLQYNQVTMTSSAIKQNNTQITKADVITLNIQLYQDMVNDGLIDNGDAYRKDFIQTMQNTLIFDVEKNSIKSVFKVKPLSALKAFEIDVVVAI